MPFPRFIRSSAFSLAVCTLSVLLCAYVIPPTPGHKAITAMHKLWKGKWYPNIAFEQKAVFYKDREIAKTETWQELLNSPGNLHIRFDGFDTGNGAIYHQDSVFIFRGGKLQSKRPETNFLALLGFDVYFYEPEATASRLEKLGFDLSKSYDTSVNGRKVTVIGASSPDDRSSSQFWIDSERLLVLRAVKNTAGAIRDVHFNKYQQIEKNWVATEMVFTDGKDTLFLEEYFNIRFPKKVAPAAFNPARFSATSW